MIRLKNLPRKIPKYSMGVNDYEIKYIAEEHHVYACHNKDLILSLEKNSINILDLETKIVKFLMERKEHHEKLEIHKTIKEHKYYEPKYFLRERINFLSDLLSVTGHYFKNYIDLDYHNIPLPRNDNDTWDYFGRHNAEICLYLYRLGYYGPYCKEEEKISSLTKNCFEFSNDFLLEKRIEVIYDLFANRLTDNVHYSVKNLNFNNIPKKYNNYGQRKNMIIHQEPVPDFVEEFFENNKFVEKLNKKYILKSFQNKFL